MLDWDKLKLFYQVATAGSITTAAERLNVSQPALSRSILNLEARLKTKLFERHKRGISLTRQGEILFRGAHRMFLESRNVEQALQEATDQIEGDLTIITTPTLAATWLMKFIPSFLEKHPDIRIKIFGQTSEADIHKGDVAIMTYLPLQPTMIQKYLTTFQMKLYASQKYLEEFGTPVVAEDLDDHRLISFNTNSLSLMDNTNWILKVGHTSSGLREPYLECNSVPGILRAAKLGLGIVELGKGYPALEGVDLVEVLPDLKGPVVDIFYIYPEHKKNVRKIRAFFEHMTGQAISTDEVLPGEEPAELKLAALG